MKGKKKKGSKAGIDWTPEMLSSFQQLKTVLLENVVLDIADPYRPSVLETDASDYA